VLNFNQFSLEMVYLSLVCVLRILAIGEKHALASFFVASFNWNHALTLYLK